MRFRDRDLMNIVPERALEPIPAAEGELCRKAPALAILEGVHLHRELNVIKINPFYPYI